MKKNLFIITLVAACAPLSYAQSVVLGGTFMPGTGTYDVIPGGSFEASDPMTDWSDYLNVTTIIATNSTAMSGARSGRMTGWSTGGYAISKETGLNLIPGKKYVLSAFIRGDETGGSVGLDIGNYGGQAWYYEGTVANALNASTINNWYFAYTVFEANNPSMRVRLIRNPQTIPYATSYFDDVAITPLNEFVAPTVVPEPGTMAALGMGALALARRKKGSKSGARR